VARWIAALPVVAITLVASVQLVVVTYRELTAPTDTSMPVAVRVAAAAPQALIAVAVAWLVCGTVAALAVRSLVLSGSGVRSALGFGLRRLITRPLRMVVVVGLPLAVTLMVLGIALGSAEIAAGLLRGLLADQSGFAATIIGLLVFVTVWGIGLVLLGVTGAWRSATLTVDAAGTFGGVRTGQAGDWKAATTSGTMADLRPGRVDPDSR
jgi:hypothetical protein